ncbi:MAG TPA: phenylalanine--tRNA ligase subunit alpha, partial [Lachnospiraceae bacterium]|nr:phenylalanine--tRNA ligase subunit alpha [Lachnospiraceae bacterium]
MIDMVDKFREQFYKKLRDVNDVKSLEELRLDFLSKKGQVSALMKELSKVPDEKKKEYGRLINNFKKELTDRFEDRKSEIVSLQEKLLIDGAESYDESLPVNCPDGSYHPITLVQRELEDIFESMGFDVEDYNEIVDDYHCFEALNIPEFHPARDMQDTYYLTTPKELLKSHTSAAQNAILKKYGPMLHETGRPIRAVFPGRCFRNEA